MSYIEMGIYFGGFMVLLEIVLIARAFYLIHEQNREQDTKTQSS